MAQPATKFLELARRRRTARQHARAPIPPAALDTILEAARWAPSAANRQPWEFVIVTDGALKRQLRAAFIDEAKDRDTRYRSVTEKQADLLLAPGLILVCGDPRTKARFINAEAIGEAAQDDLFLLSMGAAIQNMLLMATALGLTSTWIARAARIETIGAMLGVPAEIRPIAFVALGVARSAPLWNDNMRLPIATKTHRDRYGVAGNRGAP